MTSGMSSISTDSTCSKAERCLLTTTRGKSPPAALVASVFTAPMMESSLAVTPNEPSLDSIDVVRPGRYVRPQLLRTAVRRVSEVAICGGRICELAVPATLIAVTRSAGFGGLMPGPTRYQRISFSTLVVLTKGLVVAHHVAR